MRILDRYIAITFLQGFLLVMCMLVALFSFVELGGQIDNLGKNNYNLQEALIFVALTTPRRIYDFTPVSALLGSVVALGFLADRNELLAMRAAGMSVYRICGSVLVTGAFLMVALGALGEFVAPPLEQTARIRRLRALADPGILPTRQGFWARRGQSFIHVGKAFPGGLAAAIDIFTCGEEGRLETFTHASHANISANRQWLLHDIEQKIFTGYEINTKKLTNLTLDSFLTSAQVEVLQLPPDTMSGSDLYRYIRALRERGQNADTYALALWQKITLPVATGAMILLSLTFVFGPPRERTTGFRIMMGSIVGVAFFLANQLMGRMGLVMDLNPAFTTLSPVAVILFSAFWLLRRLP